MNKPCLFILSFVFFISGFRSNAFEIPSHYKMETLSAKKKIDVRLFGKKTNKIKIVLYWASWCEFCKDYSKMFEGIPEELRNKIDFVGISVDEKKDDANKAYGFHYLILKQQYWYFVSEKSEDMPTKLPYLALIDKNGVVDTIYEGSKEDKIAYLRKRLNYLLIDRDSNIFE